MTGFDANEHLTPFRDHRGYGAILFDRTQLRQPDPAWFHPEYWKEAAQPVQSGGRGGAWFISFGAESGEALLRQYLRGGLVAKLNRDRHLWGGINRVRSFAEFRLMRKLREKKLPVPLPYAAWYRREGLHYRAAILMQRLHDVQTLATLAESDTAPWEATGELIARFHRAGLDHADLNAHNILFDAQGQGWMVDFDQSRLRIPETKWREANLQRLLRSLHKQRGQRSAMAVDASFERLRTAYSQTWDKGY